MKNRVFLLTVLFLSFGFRLFSLGNSEDTQTQKEEWLLCIANFDSSALTENKKNIANTVMRKLVESLNKINYRTRVSPEYAFYETAAWERARSSAAEALAAKQNERSLLLYRGDPQWKYLRNTERIDAEIDKLRIALEKVDNNPPFVDTEPLFNLVKTNLDFNFPPAPAAGNEYKFCIDQKSDAVLTGSIAEFHDRFVVSWKLYTKYTQSVVWEDNIIFSHNDIEEAMEEIMIRLIIVLSGNEPTVITVRAEPENTLVLINRSFAGRGEIADLEFPPGPITITASAPGYENLTFKTELSPGDDIDINIRLRPVEYGDTEITGFSSGNVYHGALYIGEAPLTLRLPVNQIEYTELVYPDGERGTVVFQTPGEADLSNSVFIRTKVSTAKGRVEKSRRNYYWAWGGTWLAGITAWLSYQTFIGLNNAVTYDYIKTGGYNDKFYSRNVNMYNFSIGAFVALGVAAAFDIFFMGRYLYIANKGSTPIFIENWENSEDGE